MAQLTGRGQSKYWFQGRPFLGADHTNDAKSQKYWFQGKPVPYVYAEEATGGNIKKIAGVSWANVKKVAGVPVANIKKIAGVTA